MYSFKKPTVCLAKGAMLLAGGMAFQNAVAANSTFDVASLVLNIPQVNVEVNGAVSSFNAQLKLVKATEPFELELMSAGLNAASEVNNADRATFFNDTSNVHIPSVQVGADSFYAQMKLIPGSNPLRFTVEQLVNNQFSGCPSFATIGPAANTCVISGTITSDATLTAETLWLISGAVNVGEDNANSATLTVNPGAKTVGQNGGDYIFVRRGSKIVAEGTPNRPIVMTGANEQTAGEWGGLIIAGNAPVNGCSDGADPCELAFEALAEEKFGGNNPADNSGILKYLQINFAGFAIRPDEELNALTLLSVGSGTLLDYIQVHKGLDDGVELFGGTANMKHIVMSEIADDSLDWALGWTGKLQFALIRQGENIGDRGIEADNNPDNNDALPRSKPTVANLTAIGSATSSQGALLREGTGGHIWNSVFSGFADQCLRLDHTATYLNAGTPGNLSGELTINNSYVNCSTNFKDEPGEAFLVSDWFTSQSGNSQDDAKLNGYRPASDSPLLNTGSIDDNSGFFTPVTYTGAFANESDTWESGWTTSLN